MGRGEVAVTVAVVAVKKEALLWAVWMWQNEAKEPDAC